MRDVDVVQRNFIEKKVAEYRSRGYDVQQDCSLEFLPDFQADLVVRKDGESKVVAVKHRASPADSPGVGKLAQILHDLPGWSLELLLIGEPEKLDAPEGVRPPSRVEIRRRLAEAEKALAHNMDAAALLLAWSALEAAVRVLIALEGISIARVTKAGYLLDLAVFHGVVSRREYDDLADLKRYRNAIAHGFAVEGSGKGKARELIAFVTRMLKSEKGTQLDLRNALLIAYVDNDGSADNRTITHRVLDLTGWQDDWDSLHNRLSAVRSRLRGEGLIEKVTHPGPKGPGVHRLTPSGWTAANALRAHHGLQTG